MTGNQLIDGVLSIMLVGILAGSPILIIKILIYFADRSLNVDPAKEVKRQ